MKFEECFVLLLRWLRVSTLSEFRNDSFEHFMVHQSIYHKLLDGVHLQRLICLMTHFPSQWSLRSNLTPDSKDTCSSWREKETDDLMMMSSDSGITSPNSNHYGQQSVSPCSISVMLWLSCLSRTIPVYEPLFVSFKAYGSVTDRWYASSYLEDV